MSNSPRLGIPYLVESQAQKEVTHNEAINMLELLVHPISESLLSAPPASPMEGALYLIGLNATGAWQGKDNYITEYIGGAWKYCLPVDGMRLWDKSTDRALFYRAGSWQVETVSADVMIKSVYDTDNDGKVDAAETADKAPVNTFPVGDGTDATILIQAYNADTNKPGIRYDATDNKWQYSNDGSVWKDIGANDGVSTFKSISVAGQSDVVAESASDTLTLAAGNNVTITTDVTTDTITISATGGSGGGAIADLTDVALASPKTGQVLKYDETTSKWINAAETGGGVAGESFKTIAVSGQTSVVAETAIDTLTLAAGNNVTITTDATTDTITISATGGVGAASDSFKTIAVNGQTSLIADSATDTLTLVAGNNITITTNADADSITINSNGDETQVALASGVTAVAGTILCITATGYALASNAGITTIQGVVLCKTGGTSTATVIETGYYDTGGTSLTAGGAVYLGVDGAYTQTAPTASNSFIKCLGWAVSSGVIRFRPDTLAIQNA